MNCPNCHSIIDDDSRWCDQCGKPIMFCPECKVPRKGTSCPRCGELLIDAESFFAGVSMEKTDSSGSRARIVLEGDSMSLTICEGTFGRKGGIFPELSSCPYVSGTHGALKYSDADSSWMICDNGSTNGTFLNGMKLQKSEWHALRPGDRLRIATIDFTVKRTGK